MTPDPSPHLGAADRPLPLASSPPAPPTPHPLATDVARGEPSPRVEAWAKNLTTHREDQCAGDICSVHNPSNHRMRDWPAVWRQGKGVLERTCPHGIGHPDPDDAAHLRRTGREYLTIHGCDGCCR